MKDATGIRYIVFGFVFTWEPGHDRPLAVLTLPPAGSGVRLYTVEDWKTRVPESAVPLIGETFADWESLNPDEAARLFPHLAQSSAGSLQALRSGTYPESELAALLEEELGTRAL